MTTQKDENVVTTQRQGPIILFSHLKYLYVGVLQAYVRISEVREVVYVEDEGVGVLLGLGLRKNADGAVLWVGPPSLLAVRLRIKTLNLVLLLQSLRSQLDIATMKGVAVSLIRKHGDSVFY